MKQYKVLLSSEVNVDAILNLDQIIQLVAKPVVNLRLIGMDKVEHQDVLKLEPKLIELLEERRRALETDALVSANQQQTLHVSVMAALAGAATMLHCLPEVSHPLNPIVKPLMESIKREENEELQRLSAKHLAHLVNLCVNRTPCPNSKVCIQ